jgi:hypothetical protein
MAEKSQEISTSPVESSEQRREQLTGLKKEVNTQQEKSLTDVMNKLGIPSSYNDRYDLIHQLYENGIVLFDGTLNKYSNDGKITKYKYIGNREQNAKFKSQIIINQNLFVNGKLATENIAKWQTSDMSKSSEEGRIIEASEVEGKSLSEVLQALGIGTDYNSRYNLSQTLAKNGIPIFTGKLNPYVDEELSDSTAYIGRAEQNAKLRKNLIHNSTLFANGTVSPESAKKWEVVE